MKALIIDDEPYAAQYLQEMIQQHCFEIESTDILYSPLKAMKHVEDNVYDVIFLDVEMPEMSGVEWLKEVRLPKDTQVVFTSSFAEYAIDAFEVNAVHYILKLVSKEDLISAVRKVMEIRQKKANNEPSCENRISIFDGTEYHILSCNDIIRLQADGGYTKVSTGERDFLSSKGLSHFENSLPSDSFVRCHNSHIVNVKKVIRMGKGRNSYVTLSNDELVPVSYSKKEKLLERLGVKDKD